MNTLDEPVRRSRPMSMTPMIDVVFLLLIFFMLINTFANTQVLRFVTPAGERKSEETDFSLAAVYIRADDTIQIDDKVVPRETLKVEMQKLKAKAVEVTLVIVVEPKARTQSLIRVVEAARSAGLKNIAMKKQQEAEAILGRRFGGADQ